VYALTLTVKNGLLATLLQPYKTAKNCYQYSHYLIQLLLVLIFHIFKIVPRSVCGWMVVHFIDWWSFNFEVTC